MAVTRPTKEGGATTYQGKVGLGFPDILASEMDADLDTIYAAWNGNVGTANLVDGSVTYAKLAPDAQLWKDTGTTLIPGTSFATRPIAVPGDATGAIVSLGSATAKVRLQSSAASPGQLMLSGNRGWPVNTQDDPTKPSWGIQIGPASDSMLVQRSPAGSTTQTNLLTLDATGNLTLPGKVDFGVDAGHGQVIYNADSAGLYFNNGSAPPTTTKSSWAWVLSYGGQNRASLQYRAPNAGAGVITELLYVNLNGDLTISGANAFKASGTTWANPSDPRLKDDVAPYARGLADVLALEPITYRLKADPDGPMCYGFDAARVRGVFPECVAEVRMKLDPDDAEETDGVLSFDMHPILVALVNAVKELAARR